MTGIGRADRFGGTHHDVTTPWNGRGQGVVLADQPVHFLKGDHVRSDRRQFGLDKGPSLGPPITLRVVEQVECCDPQATGHEPDASISGWRSGMDERPLRVGLIGCGHTAISDHLPAYLARPQAFIVAAVADPTPNRLELARVAAGLPVRDAHSDPAALLARGDLDMVDLCTPQHLRHDVAIAAMGAGLHVLSEKPLATTPRDAADIVAAASKANVRLGLVHNYLFLPEVRRALEIVASGDIGVAEVGIFNWLGVVDLPGNPAYRPAWRHDLRYAGGGVLMDMLHIVYVAEALLGRSAERVSAWMDARTPQAPVEDLVLARLEVDGGAALVNIGWGVGPGGFAVSGPLGRVEVTYRDGGSGGFVPFERLVSHGRNGRREITELPEDDSTGAILDDFAAAVRMRREPIAPGSAGFHTLEVTVAAYLSAALDTTVVLPLQPGHPVYERGVAGLAELELPAWSPVRRRSIFRLSSQP
jgi:predicted dehydrogenase